MKNAYFFGIDIGTQGARLVVTDQLGLQIDSREEGFELDGNSREEQSPELWWAVCYNLMAESVQSLRTEIDMDKIRAISVSSTSGTIIPVDENFNPLHAAIMYSDQRSSEEAKICQQSAVAASVPGYMAFNSSSGLPKMKWFINNYPGQLSHLYKFIHAADFITGKLCGQFGFSDYTNALKSGYDLHHYRWPDYISKELEIDPLWLQEILPSGTPLATLRPQLAEKLGLPSSVIVTTGITDGCASQIASGAVNQGQWNTTIGTTLVIKGVTQNELIDPQGALYNHRHPEGYWMPGGASNTGADWVSKLFHSEDLQSLNDAANSDLPSTELAWPLLQAGERFPFVAGHARGFWPSDVSSVELYKACMEGVAFIEKIAYNRIQQLSGEKLLAISSAGGGSNSETWLRIRANIMNVPVLKMQHASGAAGAAVLAASKTFYNSLQEATANMVHAEKTFYPEDDLAAAYQNKFLQFIEELKTRKILN